MEDEFEMKHYQYIPFVIGCVGIVYLSTFLYQNTAVQWGISLGLFFAGGAISMLFGYKRWNKNKAAGWLGLLVNLLPLCILGFIYLNTTFNR